MCVFFFFVLFFPFSLASATERAAAPPTRRKSPDLQSGGSPDPLLPGGTAQRFRRNKQKETKNPMICTRNNNTHKCITVLYGDTKD